jgi:hypothetical protein
VGDRHKLIQGRPTQNDVKGEVDLSDIKEVTLRVEVLRRLECDRREIKPHGITDTGPTPEKGCEGWSFDIGICSFLKYTRMMILRATPPLIRMWYSLILVMVGGMISGSYLVPTMILG